MTRWIAECVGADVDPLACFSGARTADRFFWSRDDHAFAAFGALDAIETTGTGRFADAARASDALSRRISWPAAPVAARAPLLVGGFAFAAEPSSDPDWAPFPALRFWLPARTVVRRGDTSVLWGVAPLSGDEAAERVALRALLTAKATVLPAGSAPGGVGGAAYRVAPDRPPAAFRSLVGAALAAIASGSFEKLVVARSVRFESSEAVDPARLLATLTRSHPRCATFAVARGPDVFLGATPERLLDLDGRRIDTVALAGTAPRGRTPEEDARLGAALRESKKEQEEHAVVVRALREALAPLCAQLVVPESPALLQMEGLQHLASPLRGVLRAPANALDLAARLHPTPAVAGAPRGRAVSWLAAHEGLSRGWYAGGVGWLDSDCGGALAVALRCARLRDHHARLFAGAGIVAASDPLAELEETRLKLRALLGPLQEP